MKGQYLVDRSSLYLGNTAVILLFLKQIVDIDDRILC